MEKNEQKTKETKEFHKLPYFLIKTKDLYIKTKDSVNGKKQCEERSPDMYASDKVSETSNAVVQSVVAKANELSRKSFDNVIEKHKGQSNPQNRARKYAQKQAENRAVLKNEQQQSYRAQNNVYGAQVTKQHVSTSKKVAEGSAKASKGTIRMAKKTTDTVRKTATTSKQTAKTAVEAAKVFTKAAVATAKTAIAGIKSLVAVIAAGGWVAVMIIIIICLVAMVLCSAFGIFFSDEIDTEGDTLHSVMAELEAEYEAKIEEIKATTPHDEFEIIGDHAQWQDILAVYAVKASTGETANEVVTMTEEKKTILKDVFWKMCEITYHTETLTETVIVETDDGYGNTVENTETVTKTYLFITVSAKTSYEVAEILDFTEEQQCFVNEILENKYNEVWNKILNS